LVELEELISDVLEDDSLSDKAKDCRAEHLFQEWIETEGDFEKKAIMVAAWIKHQEALAESRMTEYRRIKKLAEQSQNQAEKLREYLLSQMEKANKTKIEGAIAKVSVRSKPARVVLNCELEDLPAQYQTIEITPKLQEIKKALKMNPNIEWAFFSGIHEKCLSIR
jgi:hypothetical protein